jgi:hypothetical protein
MQGKEIAAMVCCLITCEPACRLPTESIRNGQHEAVPHLS